MSNSLFCSERLVFTLIMCGCILEPGKLSDLNVLILSPGGGDIIVQLGGKVKDILVCSWTDGAPWAKGVGVGRLKEILVAGVGSWTNRVPSHYEPLASKTGGLSRSARMEFA
jgi:hypothetical protein